MSIEMSIEIPSVTSNVPGMSNQELLYRIEIPRISL